MEGECLGWMATRCEIRGRRQDLSGHRFESNKTAAPAPLNLLNIYPKHDPVMVPPPCRDLRSFFTQIHPKKIRRERPQGPINSL